MKRRWLNIFKSDNRAFVLAMDHGAFGINVLPEMAKPGEIIREAVAGGVDAILASVGIAQNFREEIGNAGLLIRMDGGGSQLFTESEPISNLYPIESLVALGADGVVCMGWPGAKFEGATLGNLASNVAECNKWGIVLGAEMLPRGFETASDSATVENIALASRIGAELGADFIKTRYTGDKHSFREIVESCYRPILVMGGDRVDSDEELLTVIKDAIEAGAAGVVIGRNIWQRSNVTDICSAIAKIVHEKSSVEKTLVGPN